MPDYSVHKAAELPRDERLVIERWLGRFLSDEETISVNAYRPHPAPMPAEREKLRQEIVSQAREIGARGREVGDAEIDALVDEALAATRSTRA